MATDGFARHCREIARRFLLTAVVVDDELSVAGDPRVHGDLTLPEPGVSTREEPTTMAPQALPPRPLPVDPITWSFARQGMVCGVVSPHEEKADHEVLAKAVARADIVILDWRLNLTSGANALPLLKRILTEDQPHRLRLIVFYTGEPDHEGIREKIVECLNGLDGPDQAVVAGDGSGNSIDFRACRIVVYGKRGSAAVDPGTVVNEEALADRLIADFADMVEGLLPSLVLTALAAVREDVYRVLERFKPDLDPAFLAHRACLRQPPESEQHIVEQIASELHGVMNDAVGSSSPAGVKAIEHWLDRHFGDGDVVFGPGRQMSHSDVVAMLTHGIEERPGPLEKGKRKGKDFAILSQGFSGDTDIGREFDRRLASVMSFRQVLADTSRQLTMGTVVRRIDDNAMLLCGTPSCDAVRLTERSSFLFLPLSEAKPKTLQVVVPVGEGEHQRMTVSLRPSQWSMKNFDPHPDRQCVLALGDGPDQPFVFRDVGDQEYEWVGELKPEFGQSIAQAIAKRMSRVPLNKSEWLRRSERFGERGN